MLRRLLGVPETFGAAVDQHLPNHSLERTRPRRRENVMESRPGRSARGR